MRQFWLLALLSLSPGAVAAAPTPLNVTATATGYTAPANVQAGYVKLSFTNKGKFPLDVGFYRLKPGATEAQFKTLMTQMTTNAAKDAAYRLIPVTDLVGGVNETPPGESDSATFLLKPGRYIIATTTTDEKTRKPLLSAGYYSYLNVTGPALDNPPPKADYRIDMLDYRFALPASVTAGRHSWHIMNSGKEAHFIVMFKLRPGKTVDDLMKALMSQDQPGPPPTDGPIDESFHLASQALTGGQAMDVTWTIPKGQYALVCFVQDKRGVPHAMMGMVRELTVR